ncbi:MAG: DNA translocase FtsK 4TM domain-containing protein [Lachnospiraceae bacterium]|nr:DNA translocase FtsK 4TM domain-containing protein [Lachnospiraceae bacterium]
MASSANNNNRKRTSSGRPRSKMPVEEALREEKEREMRIEIGTIIFVALMILVFLCNFHIIGAFGDAVSGFMFGVFGLLAYVAPIFAVVAMFYYRANRHNQAAMKKFAAVIMLYFLIGIICDMASKTAVGMESYNFAELFKLGKEGRCGGGLISGSIAYLIKSFLGNVGLVLLLILGIIIALILITEKSFINMVKEKGYDFVEKGKAYTDERRERRLAESGERRAMLEDGSRSKLPDKSFNDGDLTEKPSNEKALNLRDKLRQTDSQAPIFEEGTYVEMPPMPAKPDLDTGYKPTIRESLKAKMQNQKEKRELDRKMNREAKENNSILQVADSDAIAYGNNHSGEIHELSYGSGSASAPGAYSRDGYAQGSYATDGYGQDGYTSDGYPQEGYEQAGYTNNDNGNYPQNGYGADDYEQEILKYKIQNGETIVDMYGRPVFDFEKQEIRSAHNVEVKDQFSAMEGNTEDTGTDYYNDDEDILANKDEDILATYEKVVRSEELNENATASRFAGENYAASRPTAARPTAAKPKASFETSSSGNTEAVSAWKNTANSGDKTMAGAYATATRIPAGSHDEQPKAGMPESKPAYSNKPYKFPPINLLKAARNRAVNSAAELENTKYNLQETLRNFGVNVDITEAVQGPSVTRYEMTLEPGTKVSKILGLSDDIKLSLASEDIRIEAPIPGKSAVGIEVPNKETSMVSLRELLESRLFKDADSNLSFAVGKNIGGDVIVTDIGKMPHVLIAGATGSGKSVCINTLIMSLIYKSSPEDVQMIMIDPKVVELSVYNGIPHLMLPVVTDPKKAAAALAWGVKEMEDRYKKFADLSVRDLKGYNEKIKTMTSDEIAQAQLSGINHFKLPKIVIIIDELADLMMVCGKEVEEAICRLAQLARACGIHLVVATQRPSVDVITGLIKANMPSRMAFAVSSGVDSRTILDTVGAEKLLGKGDMLFYPQGKPKPERVQGAFVSDEEVSAVVDFLKAQRLHNEFAENAGINSETLNATDSGSGAGKAAAGGEDDGRDELFAEAGRCIINSGKCSIGYLQRMLKIGFNRAARIMDSLSEEGVVGPESGTKAREILMTIEEFESYLDS